MLNTTNTNSYLKGNIENQNKFWSGKSNLMIYANFCSNINTQPDFKFDLIDIPSALSMDFLEKHAYELGIYATKKAESAARFHMNINDDWHPHIYLHWGTGLTASIFSGAKVIFQDSTSYTKGHIIDDIEIFKYKHFNWKIV